MTTDTACWFKSNPLPHLPGHSTMRCPGCGRDVNSGQALRCRVNGPDQPPVKQPEAVPSRYDWFEEASPCQYRQGPETELVCGCGGSGVVAAMSCTETAGARCVATQSHRSRLLKNHRELYQTIRVCESCPLAVAESAPASPELCQ